MHKIKLLLNQFPRHWFVAGSAWASRAVSALIQIISIRALLSYLGEERYAVYVIVYSLSSWFALCDLGMGPAMQNFISECRTKNENYNRYLKAALQSAACLIIVFIILLFSSSSFIQTRLLGNYLSIDSVRNVNIILIIGIVFILTAFANIVYRIYYALQKGYISNMLPAVGLIFSMTAIVLFNRYYPLKGDVLTALLIFTVPQLLAALIPFIKIFKPVFPAFFDFDFDTIKKLMGRAVKFGGFAIMAALTLQVDYIIMSQTVNAYEITTYSILNKVFLLFLFVHSALIAAVWPVFSELYIKKQYLAIKNMIFKYAVFGFCIIIFGTFIFYLFSDKIIAIIAPASNIRPAPVLFIIFGLYYILRTFTDSFAVFLQSINSLKIFWIYIPFQAVISILCQYFLSLRYGIAGILLGLIISFILTACIVLPYKTYKVIKKMKMAGRSDDNTELPS